MDTELGEIVAEAANSVYEELGGGLSECIYRNALAIALRKLGCTVEAEVIVPIFYQAQYVGSLRPDIVVNKQVVLELKAVAKVTESHISQTRGYLRWLPPVPTIYQLPLIQSRMRGAVLNFGVEELEIRHVPTPLKVAECRPPAWVVDAEGQCRVRYN